MRLSIPRRRIRLVVGFTGIALPLTWAGSAMAATAPAAPATTTSSPVVVTAPASALISALNGARGSAGLAPLSSAGDLVAVATEQALAMATDGYLFHNPSLTTEIGNWQSLGENVGSGLTASSIATAFMDSTEHRDNILSTQFTQVGIGAVSYKGLIWVTEDFRLPTIAAARVASTTTPVPAKATSPAPVVTSHPVIATPVVTHAPAPVPVAAASSSPAAPTAPPAPSTPAVTPAPTPSSSAHNSVASRLDPEDLWLMSSAHYSAPNAAFASTDSHTGSSWLTASRNALRRLALAVALASLLAALGMVVGWARRTTVPAALPC